MGEGGNHPRGQPTTTAVDDNRIRFYSLLFKLITKLKTQGALTWLARLVEMIQRHYPKVVVEPHVDMSANLRDRLLAEEIDLMIVQDIYVEPRFASQPIGVVVS
ncbi:LysR substrate binding domain protein [compost metagenome]